MKSPVSYLVLLIVFLFVTGLLIALANAEARTPEWHWYEHTGPTMNAPSPDFPKLRLA